MNDIVVCGFEPVREWRVKETPRCAVTAFSLADFNRLRVVSSAISRRAPYMAR